MNTYELVGDSYTCTSQAPKDYDLFYRCLACDTLIPSIPSRNVGCECGNVYIEIELNRLMVLDFDVFEVLRLVSAGGNINPSDDFGGRPTA